VSFNTIQGVTCPGFSTVTDIDGNIYNTVQIGIHCWTKENLRVTKYRDGTIIPLDASGGNSGDGSGQTWGTLTTGARTIYGNSLDNLTTYGYMYNWYAAVNSKGICPTGWHVPTDADWDVLASALGGSPTAGFAMKNTSGWASAGNGSNNSGFTALPAGFRRETGAFDGILSHAYWWSSTAVPSNSANAYHRRVSFNAQNLYRDNSDKRLGYSIRCIRD